MIVDQIQRFRRLFLRAILTAAALTLMTASAGFAQDDGGWHCVNPTAGDAGVCSYLFQVHSDGFSYVAVGDRGKIMTSDDGVAWRDQDSGTTALLNGITSNGSTWVAVGEDGVILTSTDTETWTARNSGSGIRLADVIWAGGQFVVVGGEFLDSSRILTSPGGETWTPRTSATRTDIRSIGYDGLTYVAVGASGTMQTSPDGVTWTLVPPQASGANLNGVTSDGGIFVAVGQGSSFGGPFILSSPDGLTWTERETGRGTLNDVLWGNGQFVAVGQLGHVWTSPDGISWTQRASAGNRELFGVAFDGASYLAVGDIALMSSANASSWTDRLVGNLPFFGMGLNGVTWTGAQFLAVGDSGLLLRSTGGVSWFELDRVGGRDLYGLALGAGAQVALAAAAESGRVFTSDDLLAWEEKASETTSDLLAIANNGFRFVAVGIGGSIQTSQLGENWTTATSPTALTLRGITWTGSEFVVVGDDGTLLTSPDGTVWTQGNTGVSHDLHDVVWDGFRFLVSAADGHLGTSVDGTSWSFHRVDQVPPFWSLYGVHATRFYYAAVGALGSVQVSDNATASTWTQVDGASRLTFEDVGGNDSVFLAVGDGGIISYSLSPIVQRDGFEAN